MAADMSPLETPQSDFVTLRQLPQTLVATLLGSARFGEESAKLMIRPAPFEAFLVTTGQCRKTHGCQTHEGQIVTPSRSWFALRTPQRATRSATPVVIGSPQHPGHDDLIFADEMFNPCRRQVDEVASPALATEEAVRFRSPWRIPCLAALRFRRSFAL